MSRVLVLYATRHGSTREVAEAVGAAATAAGASVRVEPAASFRGRLTDGDLVVLGAPLYSGRWHRDAHRFLKHHRAELDRVPVVVFGMGPRRDEEEAWQRSRSQLDRALARRPWFVPAAVAVFGGTDPPGKDRGDRRDLRDWAEIGDWARKVLGLAAGVASDPPRRAGRP